MSKVGARHGSPFELGNTTKLVTLTPALSRRERGAKEGSYV